MKFPNRKIIERLKEKYPLGTRVELLKMDDIMAPPTGTKGYSNRSR